MSHMSKVLFDEYFPRRSTSWREIFVVLLKCYRTLSSTMLGFGATIFCSSAIRYLQSLSIRLCNDNVDVLIALGHAFMEVGDSAAAFEQFGNALTLDPTNTDVRSAFYKHGHMFASLFDCITWIYSH
jgi:hypothetical protein